MPDISASDIESDFDDFSDVFTAGTITVFGASTGLSIAAIPYTTTKDGVLEMAGLVAPTDRRIMIKTSDIPETITRNVTEITMDSVDYLIVGDDRSPESALTILRLRELGAYP